MKFNRFLFLVFIMSGLSSVFAQQDTIITHDNNLIVGEIKTMDRGVLSIETAYSDKDFQVEWKGISKLRTNTLFLITTSEGNRHLGRIATDSTGIVTIIPEEGPTQYVEIDNVVLLSEVEKGFWSRVYASIEFGYSFTKANNLQQITSRSSLGYIAEKWSVGGSYNTLISSQDSVETINRTDGEFFGRYFLPHDYYITVQVNFLTNSEQKLELRQNPKLGIGKYMIHTNQSYWGASIGIAYNLERYSTDAADRTSTEAFFGTELNLYDIGDLNLLTNVIAYPSLTKPGRWRADGQFDMKYDFPLDFYLKLGFSVNYDNEPVEGASEVDYVFQTTLGWEW